MNEKIISEEEKKKTLQRTIFYFTDKEPFYGSLLQEITTKYSTQIPTAGITYNLKEKQYEVYVNPHFFCKRLNHDERVAVFHHEIMHFTNKHLFRLPFTDKDIPNQEKQIYNIAGDMAINQYIQGLPSGCSNCKNVQIKSQEEWEKLHSTEELIEKCPGKGIDVKEWKLDDGKEFPLFQTMEQYYELIKSEKKKQDENNDDKKKGKGSGSKGNVPEKLSGFKSLDEHFWDSLDEETKKEMLSEAKKLLTRTIEKTSFSHSVVPDSIKDLLQEIDGLITGLNYKQLLKSVIKKTVSCIDRENTWKKPNKRYGAYSPGTKVGALPNLSMFIDTSGSISHKELNDFLKIMANFLKVGTRQCWLGLWHTELYYKKKYKLNAKINKEEVQSGGTNITSALEDIKKSNPNLAIILTDGYYEASSVKPTCEIIFIISSGGNQEHPMKHLGKTILLDKIKD